MTKTRLGCAFLAAVLATATALAASGAGAQNLEIGVAAAVNPQATGTPPARQTRILNVGINVFASERIVTTAAGQTQMLFRDQSALTIGPNSDVVLDEFVYDPSQKTGKIVLRATKGLFRLVGGRISKKTPVQLKTPTATIGIRGGIAVIDIAASGATDATFLFGDAMTVAAGGVTKAATRAGFVIQTSARGGPPSDPVPATDAQIQGSLAGLEGSSESAAASGEDAPQDSDVAQSGLAAVGSSNDPDDVAPTTAASGADDDTGAVDTGAVEETADKEEGTQNSIGTVIAGTTPNVYQAVGEWSYTMNFSSPSSSTGHLDSFDGSDYTLGGATLAANSTSINTFSGSITGTSHSGSFLGSFMKSSSDDAAEMGGHFQLSGTDYKASGIFAAKK